MSRKPRAGFTLIELLVVIAIIAILAAILFPVFAQARERARMTTCLNNMKQMGTAMVMYTQDYDGYFPKSWYSGPQYGFDVAIYPYLKNIQVFACPSNPTHPFYDKGYYMGPIKRSYAMNGDISTDLGPIFTEAMVERPSEVILMLETTDWYRTVGPDHETYVKSQSDVCYHVPFTIHNNGSNYTFVDGHAKWAKVQQTWGWWLKSNKPLGLPDTYCQKRMVK